MRKAHPHRTLAKEGEEHPPDPVPQRGHLTPGMRTPEPRLPHPGPACSTSASIPPSQPYPALSSLSSPESPTAGPLLEQHTLPGRPLPLPPSSLRPHLASPLPSPEQWDSNSRSASTPSPETARKHCAGPDPGVSDSASLGRGLRICVSSRPQVRQMLLLVQGTQL